MAPSVDRDLLHPAPDTDMMTTSPSDTAINALETDLKVWYTSISPRYVDLVSDFAGQEFFIVDGEAVIQSIFNDPMLDLGGSKGGFQMLHCVYLVERFLLNLIRRRCRFAVVFFQDFANVTALGNTVEETMARVLARKLAIQHIHDTLSGKVEFRVFESFASADFEEYIATTLPYFVMSHDGSFNEEDIAEQSQSAFRLVRMIQRGFLFQMNRSRIASALIGEITFMDTKILTFVSEPTMHRTRDNGMSNAMSMAITHALKALNRHVESMANTLWSASRLDSRSTVGLTSPFPPSSAAIATYLSTFQDHPHCEIAFVFLCHVAMLDVLPLHDRAQANYFPSLSPTLNTIVHDEFLPRIYNFLSGIGIERIDVIDGRLFGRMLWEFTSPDSDIDHTDPIVQKAQELWSQATAKLNVNLDLVHLRTTYPRTSTPIVQPKVEPRSTLTYFSHPAISKYLIDPILPESTDWTPDHAAVGFRKSLLHEEMTHWHSSKELLPSRKGPAEQPSAWQLSRRRRADQLYRASMQRYAESMTGQGLSQITIVLDTGKTKVSTKKIVVKNDKKPKALSKKELIIANNKKSKHVEERKKAVSSLRELEKNITDMKIGNIDKKVSALQKAIIVAQTKDDARLVIELQILKIREYLMEWDVLARGKSVKFDDIAWIPVEMYRALQTISTSSYTTTTIEKIKSFLRGIGLPIPTTGAVATDDDVLPFTFPMTSKVRIPCTAEEFQLRFCGPYMVKALDAKADDRVQFVPDGWQRKVLDILDKNESVITVAPTSAGKTYIAYYAMEKILRGDDDGVLVYIAPTKALVNQIGAEVYARFSKKYPSAGSTIWAIHTRDYRINNPYGCQILVTVPEMLQVLLLSPRVSKAWAPRLRRIIFDEVHSIGNLEEGVVWEQLLLTTTVPLIALSATIGNAQEFQDWLSAVQKYHGIKCHLVVHPYRYSHLRKFVYLPNNTRNEEFNGFDTPNSRKLLEDLPGFESVHPYAALSVARGTFPPDLALDSSDCWHLFSVMDKVASNSQRADIVKEVKKLQPETFFKSTPYIKNADMINYESALRQTMERWIADSSCKDLIDGVISALSGSIDRQVKVMETSHIDISPYTRDEYQKSLLPLLNQLNDADKLPALVFHYDRNGIERIAQELVTALETAENKWKAGNADWQSKVEQWRKWKNDAKTRQKREDAKLKSAKSKSLQENAREGAEGSWLDTFDPDKPLPQFSFQSPRSKVAGQELEDDIAALTRWNDIPDFVASGLRRGIGIHHSGCNRKLRSLIETLFRAGTLRVVIATGTLALGINMPCRTVIFAGDSVFLTSLNYRQCSGRAGRRGFDAVGNVVFHGIPLSKVYRLMVSRIPDLMGHFPISTTLTARLLQVLSATDRESDYGIKAVHGLLEQSRISLGSDRTHKQVLHHFRFSIEYLLRQNLINSSGDSVALAGLISHLYYTEPSNFALAELLRYGVFHRICAGFDRTKPDSRILEEMVLVLAHLFGRVIRRKADQEEMETVIKQSPSKVILDPLPEDARTALINHNAKVVEIYRSYAIRFGRAMFDSRETKLPLSEIRFEPQLQSPSALVDEFCDNAIGYSARSAFVATSGHGDAFDTIDDLANNTREGILVEAAAVPSMDVFIDPPILNAYLLDFFKHGQVDALVNGNGIRRGEVWYVLDSFDRILSAIDESLKLVARGVEIDFAGEEMGKYAANKESDVVWETENNDSDETVDDDLSLEDKRVCEAFSVLRSEFRVKFKKMWA